MIRNGSITVVDLTDGTNSYLHIAWANDTSGTDFSTSDSTNKLYIGVYSDSNTTGSTDYTKYSWTRIKGEPGATGATGATGPQGTSVVKTEIEYYKRVQGGAGPGDDTTGSTDIPNYEPGSTYYKRTVTYLSEGDPVKGDWIQDTGLTNEIKNAYDAWVAAGAAELEVRKIITDSSGITVAAGVNGADVTKGTISTYGYNTIMAPNYLGLRYNDINLAKLTTTETIPALEFYVPTVNGSGIPTQGAKGLSITSDALTFYNPTTSSKTIELGTKNNVSILSFYNPSNSSISMMDLTSSGLVFKNSAGAELGKFGSTGLEMSGTLNIKGGGRIGQDSNNYWKFGDYISYKDNSMAYLLGYGEASIQLGETGHWRLDKNRIHTGWYQLNDSTQGQLHFDTGMDDGSTYYWDYGMHYPNKAGNGNNKFIYVRRSNDTTTSVSLATMKCRIDDDTWWIYKFYIDGNGNVHAPAYYVGEEPLSGGVGSIAEKIINSDSTYGKGSATQPIYIDSNGRPAVTTYALNAAGAKGVVTDLTNNTTSTDLPTVAAVVSYVTTRGYITSYKDEKVKTENKNTTKLWITGTATGEDNTGTLAYDSNVYIDTTAGALHATTYNGYTLAAASAKGVDTSIAAASTSTNLPTSKAVAAFVEGKGYITSYSETDPVFAASVAHGITTTDINNWNAKTSNTGTVTSVRVQASSPLQSSVSTAQSSSLDTTISFANQNANKVLAGPSSGNAAAPSFRSLVAADIPNLSWSKITSDKPTTLSGYGITDAAGLNAIVGLSASSNDAGVTTFTATRASGTNPLSFEVSIVASAATGANALKDSTGLISKGSATKPVYFNNGVPAEANTYAGGTAVTLNNASKASSTASFYAPTSGGTTAQILVGNGTTSAPTWKAISDIVPSKASTADAFSSAVTVALTGDTTGSASSTKGWSITTKTDRISTVGDNRAVATTPNDYVNKIIFQGLKTNSSFGSPSTDTYSYVVGLRGWSDSSGGNAHELAFNNSGINHRSGATTSWGAWEKLISSTNYTDYTVTKTGTGASGTWGISISGTATKATNDSDGNAINTTYLKRSGGSMTGVLTMMGNQYADSYSGALNMNNSNIYGVNSIYTADLSDNSQEGIHFYRTSTTVDTIYAQNGNLYFVPNRTLGSNGTSYTILHTGNYTSTLNNKYVTIDTDQTITASQKTFTGAIRWGNASKYGAAHYDSTLEAIVFSFA